MIGLIAQGWARASGPETPAISTILSNVVKRSEFVASRTNVWLQYNRVAILHYLDSKEQIDTKSKKQYWVVVGNGQTQSVLVSEDDKPIEEGKEEKDRQERRREFAVTHKLVGRYEFAWAGKEELAGRSCYKLTFLPRKNLEDESILEKVLNRLAGTIWVDAEEHEVAKMDVRLLTPASFFGGFVGSISKIQLRATKQKVAPDFWANTGLFIEMKGRKVLSGFHFRAWEEAKEFSPLPDPYAALGR